MTARTWMLSALLAASACLAESPPAEPPPDTDEPECQIQAEEEKSPGYPFNLDLYANQVLPVVTLTCGTAGCHGPPAGQKGFTVWPSAAPGNCDYARTFNSLVDFVDLANPTNSALYVAISGANPAHPLTWQADDERLRTLVGFLQNASDTWIADGNGGTPPPPGASPFDYAVYQDAIQPILDSAADRGCALSGCHGTGAGGFSLIANPATGSDEMKANF